MKKMFLKSLLISFGMLFVPLIKTAEPRGGFGHIGLEDTTTDPVTNQQAHKEKEHDDAAEALRLKTIQEEELKLRTPHHAQLPLHDQDPLKRPVLTQPSDITIENTLDATLTDEELTALRETEHRIFSKKNSTEPTHLTDHHAQLNFIRTKIIQHLNNELATIRSKLTTEQIKNREMVIKFFEKAGELTKENLKAFHKMYEKLAEWKEGTKLTLTPEEQKEMKLFLQSIVTTYCTKHQTIEKAL